MNFAAALVAGTLLIPAPGAVGVASYQRWIDASRMPAPRERVELVLRGCPGSSPTASCTSSSERSIYLGRGAGRHELLHELGHRFDYRMPAWARARFLRIIGAPGPWRSPPASPNEQFADAYALCAENAAAVPKGFTSAVGYRPTLAGHRATCRLIAAVGRSDPRDFAPPLSR